MKVGRYDFTQGTDVKHKNKPATAAASTKVEKSATKSDTKSAPSSTNQVALQSFAETLAKASETKAPETTSPAPIAASTKPSLTAAPVQNFSAPLMQVPTQAAQALAQDAGTAAKLDGLKSNMDQAAASQDDKKIRTAAREFEAIFMGMMFKTMKSTVEDGGLIEKSYAREMFEGMYLDEVGKSIASGKGTGLGEMIYKQMSRDYGKKEVAADKPAGTPSTTTSTDEKKVETSGTKG